MFVQGYGYLRPFSAIVDLAMTRSEVAATDLRAYCRDVLQVDVGELDDTALRVFNYIDALSPVMPLLRSYGMARRLQLLRAAKYGGVFGAEYALDGCTRSVYFVGSPAMIKMALVNFQGYLDEGFIDNVPLSGRADMLRHEVYSNFAEVFCELGREPERAAKTCAWLSLTDSVFFTLSEPVAQVIRAWYQAE